MSLIARQLRQKIKAWRLDCDTGSCMCVPLLAQGATSRKTGALTQVQIKPEGCCLSCTGVAAELLCVGV